MEENPMRAIEIEKVVINIGCGEGGEKLDNAKKLLETITGKKILITKTHKRTTFGAAKGRPIGCKVTLRKSDAKEFLKKALDAVGKKLPKSVFDTQGNFSFGIKEHIDIPGTRYDPDTGIYGMDICVTLQRKGFRVLRKKLKSKIGRRHKIAPEEAKQFVIKSFGVVIE